MQMQGIYLSCSVHSPCRPSVSWLHDLDFIGIIGMKLPQTSLYLERLNRHILLSFLLWTLLLVIRIYFVEGLVDSFVLGLGERPETKRLAAQLAPRSRGHRHLHRCDQEVLAAHEADCPCDDLHVHCVHRRSGDADVGLAKAEPLAFRERRWWCDLRIEMSTAARKSSFSSRLLSQLSEATKKRNVRCPSAQEKDLVEFCMIDYANWIVFGDSAGSDSW